ncbi:MAG: 3'-5' exonuclease [Pseudohaliea sp.]
MKTFAVIDFETTGLAPGQDRVIEVGVVLVRGSRVVDTFESLMDPGFSIPSYITDLTGISTSMVRGKPSPESVMPEVAKFIGNAPCVAHNASFDQRFFTAETRRAGVSCNPTFLCSMLLARRLVQDASNHKLGSLVAHLGLRVPRGARAHRSLADCLVTVELWNYLMLAIESKMPGYDPDPDFVAQLARVPKASVNSFFVRSAARLGCTAIT